MDYKKMIAMAGALACAVAVADGVESANVVGYANKTVTLNNRSMRAAATFLCMGENPTAVKLSDIKQTVGDPGDLTLCTYDDNVTQLHQYQYFSSAATGGELPEGWYVLDASLDPDFDKGPQDFELAAGDGFVVVSGNSSAVLQFPSAM